MMPNFLRWPSSRRFVVVFILFALLVAASAQQSERLVKADDPPQITDAVMITDIAVANRSVDCGLFLKPPSVFQPVAPFQAGNDWLQNMTITVFNRTNKTIVFGAIFLNFLDTGDCHNRPCAVEEIHLGQIPAVDAYNGRTGQPLRPDHPERLPLAWNPGQRLKVSVGDYMSEIGKNLDNHLAATAVKTVAVHLGTFFFEDGMRWISPGYSIPDPQHRGRFTYLPLNYFPGQRAHNFPPGYDR